MYGAFASGPNCISDRSECLKKLRLGKMLSPVESHVFDKMKHFPFGHLLPEGAGFNE